MSQKSKSKREKRRDKSGPMPMGGAGLIRFYQDQSNGIKVSPITSIILSLILIALVIMAHNNILDWLF